MAALVEIGIAVVGASLVLTAELMQYRTRMQKMRVEAAIAMLRERV